MQKILVTGGCGYIGSHTLIDLIENGYAVVSVDSLLNSSEDALDGVERVTGVRVKNYAVDLTDLAAARAVFEQESDVAGIIHFAALKSVGESVDQPLRYYRNNLVSLLNILDCARAFRVANFIFSSSCSVYGNADELPVTERTPRKAAESPYAATKQMGEDIIRDFVQLDHGVNAILLRYFNPAGAHPSAELGEAPSNPASSLVPVITETAIGKRTRMQVFGDDYDTRDGSCVRDYIHVMDLANAHTKCFEYLAAEKNESRCEIFNVGIGEGATVLEAINAFKKVSGEELNYQIGPRRAGDVVSIYADNGKANERLGWAPQYDMAAIMDSAWKWEKRRSSFDVG